MSRRAPHHTLSGIELRFVLIVLLVDAAGPLRVRELVDALTAAELPLFGRPSKVVSDALRWEVRKGRVRRFGRIHYTAGTMPRSTAWWIRGRADAARTRLSLLQPAGGAPERSAPGVAAPVPPGQ